VSPLAHKAAHRMLDARDDWETPQALFDALDAIYDFDVDLAATRATAKCPMYLGPDKEERRFQDSFAVDWRQWRTGWLNPPYGRECFDCPDRVWRTPKHVKAGLAERTCTQMSHRGYDISDWARKAFNSAGFAACRIVMLTFARTDTKWWHEHAIKTGGHFIKGRVKFLIDGSERWHAPAPSAVIVFDGLPPKPYTTLEIP